ncbi:hypothetical protein [Alcaligenes sp. GCM10023179]|uniref:hypothetical protein n=1 Tax=Alcaligenes sp. GCM10023179 TaxID=3252633 RepID=UPI0036187E95
MIPFLVCAFQKSTFSNLIKECINSDFLDIFNKPQIDYIFRYLEEIGAKSVVLEYNYIDKDYLDDYSKFYVRRFNSSGHTCSRLHFFSKELDHQQLETLLNGNVEPKEHTDLQSTYLGFMVIKPLPKTFIGRTCLKQYSETMGPSQSKFSLLSRLYHVSFFGVPLTVNSIAFQEQDKIVAACATTSIWCALNAMFWKQVREIPSCSQITTDAINFIEGSNNSFPNKDLSNKQILRALDVEGLRHHFESLKRISAKDLVETIKCYIDSRIPVILGTSVFSADETGEIAKFKGAHAVTVLGYKVSESDQIFLYLHDDRLGPFVRAALVSLDEDQRKEVATNNLTCGIKLQMKEKGEWLPPHEWLVPEHLIAATNRKVRIPLSSVQRTCRSIIRLHKKEVKLLKANVKSESNSPSDLSQIDFRIRLLEISDLKKVVWERGSLVNCQPPESTATYGIQRLEFLTSSLARFQWIVEFSFQEKPAFDMLIDATDIPQGDAVSAILVRDSLSADAILALMLKYADSTTSLEISDADPDFLSSFLRKLRKPKKELNMHLDETFGKLRAPRYFKAPEVAEGDLPVNPSASSFYDASEKSLEDLFPALLENENAHSLIWVITHDGSLVIADEVPGIGHPRLTGFRPARIAGELKRASGKWIINGKSGRYSGDYENKQALLDNALRHFKSIFPSSRNDLTVDNNFTGSSS